MGEANILVIPVWFNDSSDFIFESNKSKVKDDIQKAYFGTNQETGWRSVKTYYEEESHGALTLNGKVADWYLHDKSYTYYRNDGNSSKTCSLVKSASDDYFDNNPGDSRTNYDKDGDGYLDSVMLIYGAPDCRSLGGGQNNLWAYCYWADDPQKDSAEPGLNVFFWASYDFMYNGSKAFERTGKTTYANGDTSHCTIDAHTYIHEMGHVFGLEDYYDYSQQYNPAGGFSMQDYNVGGHDPFSSYALGWGSAYIPKETTTIDLKPFAETGEMILLSPNPNSRNSPFDEYLLLEYYTPTGLNKFDCDYKYSNAYPRGPKDCGIRLWHVDARLAKFNSYDGSLTLTTNPPSRSNLVIMAMSNTYEGNGINSDSGYLSRLGSAYYDFNILQLIRNDSSATYKPDSNDNLKSDYLYKSGSSFSMSDVGGQFFNNAKLNKNIDLGFTFTVNSTNEYRASITVTKL